MTGMRLTLIAAAIGLASCGVGEGIALQSLSIVSASNTTTTVTQPSAKIFRCVRDGLSGYGTFSDGEVGNYTNRGHWSSSDESIVHVSNGDPVLDNNPAQANTVFLPGTLTAIAPGTATVSFDYVGLHQEIQVTVADLDPSKITITPADTYIAPGSLEVLRATADLDGDVVDISRSAQWSFTTPDDTIAKIGATTGIVTAVTKTGGAMTVKATFTACDVAPTTTVTVAPIKKLQFQREFTPVLTELVVGTSELIKVIASFDGTDKTQDLSTQATFGSQTGDGSTSPIQFAVSAGLTNEMIAAAAGGPVGIAAFFDPDGAATVYEPVAAVDPSTGLTGFTISAVPRTLNSVSIEPKNPTIPAKGTQQFKAIGIYDGGTHTQDITRHVGWTSSDSSIAAISNLTTIAGLAASLKDEAGSVTITALATVSAQVSGDNATTLTISAPAP